MLEVKKAVAVVTGGASGIGLVFSKISPIAAARLSSPMGALTGDVYYIQGGLRLGPKG